MSYHPISDYGLIGDMHDAALAGLGGSIDWCCIPRLDSDALFSRILDDHNGGYFKVAPEGEYRSSRRYLPGTNVLETTFTTPTGAAVLTDFMPTHNHESHTGQPLEFNRSQRVTRTLQCTTGSVDIAVEVFPRFSYGTILPHAALSGPHAGLAHGGSGAISFFCSSPLEAVGDGFRTRASFVEGEKLYAAVTNQTTFSHEIPPLGVAELEKELSRTLRFWEQWSAQCHGQGELHDQVLRSALTLKVLTYAPSGGLVAAPTTSLPETVGGARNWDYRFTWIRDATFALYALSIIGYTEEAEAFKNWLEWSTSGRARDLQVMYGLGGERRLTEIELLELEGYRKSRPVRIGNGAYSQFQLDIYGEIMDSAHIYLKFGGAMDPEYWKYLQRVVAYVMDHWQEPDEGIWETRGGRQHFVFSKVMFWVALDRAIKAAVSRKLEGDVAK